MQFYTYKFEGDFYQDNQLISKISLQPKHNSGRTWTGTIYIVEDSWEIYGIDLTIDASILQIPILNYYRIKQSFVYNKSNQVWVKNLQEISFEGKFLKNFFHARFMAHYQDYVFGTPKHKFSRERMRILPEVIKTDSFWDSKRPIALTTKEVKDYIKKDSLLLVKKSKTYLDSIDKKFNKLKLKDIATGYTYRNSAKEWRISYTGLLNSPNLFNTVQGISLGTGLKFSKTYSDDYSSYLRISTDVEYGVTDERLRVSGQISRLFNSINYARLNVFAGVKTSQFDRSNSIKPLWNTVYTLLDNRNYMKLYDLGRYGVNYFQEITNGVYLSAETAWETRSALHNTNIRKKYADRLTSNNPLQPEVEGSAAFENHSLLRTRIGLTFRFAQDYYSHPNRKIVNSSKGPVLQLGMIAGNFSSEGGTDFLKLLTKISQTVDLKQLGYTRYLVHAGTFLNNYKETNFVDLQHFTGNETYIGNNILESFQLLPYYKHSTSNTYLAMHWEHQFKNAIMRRIPLLRDLKLQLVTGANFLAVNKDNPYTEWYVGLDKIGIKSWRLLRVDFVSSYYNSKKQNGLRFSIDM